MLSLVFFNLNFLTFCNDQFMWIKGGKCNSWHSTGYNDNILLNSHKFLRIFKNSSHSDKNSWVIRKTQVFSRKWNICKTSWILRQENLVAVRDICRRKKMLPPFLLLLTISIHMPKSSNTYAKFRLCIAFDSINSLENLNLGHLITGHPKVILELLLCGDNCIYLSNKVFLTRYAVMAWSILICFNCKP